MELYLDKDKCDNCGQCMANCPNLLSVNALQCKHCGIENAECKNICKQNAIYEIAEGILSIDSELCNGCRGCIEACPENAICFVDGKATKCDLCAENDFFIQCIRACEKNAIIVKENKKNTREIENILGWGIIKEIGNMRSIEKTEKFEIVDLQKEKKYLIRGFPAITKYEAFLVKEVLEKFKADDKKKVSENEIYNTLKTHCTDNLIELDSEQKEYILNILKSQILGFGPLSSILENQDIEEIAAIGIGSEKPVYVFHRNHGWLETNFYYANEDAIKNTVNRMARGIGRRLAMQTPKLNAFLPDGSRLNATINPVSLFGPTFTIRKFRKEAFTPLDLIRNKTCNIEVMAFLWLAMQTDSSILIAGNTGSGKTTTLNALFSFVPKNERIVITEETPEISLPHKQIVKLNVVENLEIGMQELISETLRMRPDRIIVGEIRTRDEISAFIDTLLAGQGRGSYATFHAQSTTEAITRLKKHGILDIDIGAIDLIVIQRRWKNFSGSSKGNEIRRIVEVAEVIRDENQISLNKIFGFDYKNQKLKKINESIKIADKTLKLFACRKEEIRKNLKNKQNFLKKRKFSEMKMNQFFEEVNNDELFEK